MMQGKGMRNRDVPGLGGNWLFMKRDGEQEVEMALGSTSEAWVDSDASTGGDTDRGVQGHTRTPQPMVIRPPFSGVLSLYTSHL